MGRQRGGRLKILQALAAAALLAGGGLWAPGSALARPAADYGAGDVCHPPTPLPPGQHKVACQNYPSRVADHRANCHWVRETYDGADHDFELCKDSDGVWRPSGRA
jgi:hypothetical protein